MSASTPTASGPVLRRRRQDHVPREKTSLSLRADVLEAAKEIVHSGKAENLSAFVESAIEEKLLRTKRADLYAAYDTAATDADFQKSMSDVAHDFAASDTDSL